MEYPESFFNRHKKTRHMFNILTSQYCDYVGLNENQLLEGIKKILMKYKITETENIMEDILDFITENN